MSDAIWVINASPLILLGKLGRTDLLEGLRARSAGLLPVARPLVERLAESGS